MKKYNKTKKNKGLKDRYDYKYIKNVLKVDKGINYLVNDLKVYLENYPDDYPVYSILASILITQGRNDDAQKVIDFIKKETFYNPEILKIKDGKYIEKLKMKVAYAQLRIYMYNYDYKNALNYITENKRILISSQFDGISLLDFYCKYRLGIWKGNIGETNYKKTQFINYSEEAFINHIKKHLMSSNSEEETISKFYEDFAFDKVFAKVKEIVPNPIAYHPGFYEDAYFFKYDDCGKIYNKNTNYFEVITISGTDHFITMCPTDMEDSKTAIDLNYLKKPIETRVRELSQIDKFNKKYNMK